MKEYGNLIGGEQVGASDHTTFETRNPARNGEVPRNFPSASAADAAQAVAAAEAFPAWAATPAPARARRRRRGDHAVELPDRHPRLEDRARPGVRQRGRLQAGVGDALAGDPIVRGLTFTGSHATGTGVLRASDAAFRARPP